MIINKMNNLVFLIAVAAFVVGTIALVKVTKPLKPYEIVNGLEWTQIGSSNFYTASHNRNGITNNSKIQAQIVVNESNVDDAYGAWLLSVYPESNSINFIVAANPQNPNNFPILFQILNP